MVRIVAQAPLVWLALFASGCMSSNHDALAVFDASPSSQPDAGEDAPDSSGPDGSDEPDAEDASSIETGADAPPPIQPDGPSVFTFVHGVTDAPSIRVCFAVRSSGTFELLQVAPWPADPLAYAHAASTTVVPGHVDLAVTDIRPVVFTGDLSLIQSKNCDALASPPDGVQASFLSVIPAGTLSHGRSVLMAAAGCVGGDTHTDAAQETICGVGYTPDHPTITLLIASADRVPAPGSIGLQVFTASIPTPLSQVDHVVADPEYRTTIARDLAVGVLAPQPPNTALGPDELGGELSGNRFELFDSGMPGASASILVSAALSRGGLASQDITDGRNFTVVLVGPRAGLGDGAWWNGFTMTLLPNDP